MSTKKSLSFIIMSVVIMTVSACSSGGIKDVLTSGSSNASQTIAQQCKQYATDYVRDNWQKIGRDWIKHEEFRQYEICVRQKKREKEINKKR